ncbi:MAG TPA: STAS domain-containing protein [Acidimicrobiia bacterium]
MGLLLDVTPANGGADRILSVKGEVDIATVGELEEKIAEVGDAKTGLILDLTATDFMDSSGLRLLVSTHERLTAEGGRFRLAVSPGPISRLLEVTGLMAHLNVHETVEEAASA